MSESARSKLGTGTGTADLSENDRMQLLSSERRMTTIEVLADRTAPVSLDDLAAAVAEREGQGETVDDEDVDSVEVSLHHVHLPKLSNRGVVDYDPDSWTVERVSVRIDALVE